MLCTKCGKKIGESDKICPGCGFNFSNHGLSQIEIAIRMILGVALMIYASVVLMACMLSFEVLIAFFMIFFFVFGVYLVFIKRNYVILNILFFGFSLCFYAFGWMAVDMGREVLIPLFDLKGFWLIADKINSGIGFDFSGYLFFSGIVLLFTCATTFALLSSIYPKIQFDQENSIFNFKKFIPNKWAVHLILLVTIVLVLGLPWLHKIQIVNGHSISLHRITPWADENGKFVYSYRPQLAFTKNTVKFDKQNSVWVYTIELDNNNILEGEEGHIKALKGITNKGKTITIAPPFGENIQINDGTKTDNGITITKEAFKPFLQKGEGVILKISTREPLLLIAWIEENNQVGGQVSFWK